MEDSMMRCQLCGTPYPSKLGKKHCSDDCRNEASKRRKDAESRELWAALRPLTVHPDLEAAIAMLDMHERVQQLIVNNAPEGATCYRIGCPRPGIAPIDLVIHWFPGTEEVRPCVYQLMPFEQPRAPYQGRYAVAYFGVEGQLLRQPHFTILIPWEQPMIRWCRGDRKLMMDGRRW